MDPEVTVETPDSEDVVAIQKTTRIPSGDEVETLLDELQEKDPKKRRQAIWKLAQTADSRAMESLVDLMIDTDSQERSLILEALSQISTRTLKPMNHALTLSLQDKNPQVRKNAIRDLTRIHDLMSQIYQLLCHSIEDSDREVQETAKWAINQLNTQIPPRLDMVTGENPPEVTVEEPYSDFME
ncbi:HEAT repeat domain-containing protein [Crocosphaera watsonii]|uniref:Putative peptidoglycan-binding domain-containing protein n=1 Tax=Crocosphaera watsonii WH 0401 TaxID=555881 RepID=T2JCF6_CROWT|nr:Putative peptidoglycan-binding domain-containing protein [Crocosphaera watsonii WH 0401]